MKDLIEALTILIKYGDASDHEDIVLAVRGGVGIGVNKDAVSPEDAGRLRALGFHWDNEHECWVSFRFGSC